MSGAGTRKSAWSWRQSPETQGLQTDPHRTRSYPSLLPTPEGSASLHARGKRRGGARARAPRPGDAIGGPARDVIAARRQPRAPLLRGASRAPGARVSSRPPAGPHSCPTGRPGSCRPPPPLPPTAPLRDRCAWGRRPCPRGAGRREMRREAGRARGRGRMGGRGDGWAGRSLSAA